MGKQLDREGGDSPLLLEVRLFSGSGQALAKGNAQFKVLRKATESQSREGAEGREEAGRRGRRSHALKFSKKHVLNWVALQWHGLALRGQGCGQLVLIYVLFVLS